MRPGAEQSFISGHSRLNITQEMATDPMRPSVGNESSFNFDQTLDQSVRSYSVAQAAENDKSVMDTAIQRLLGERPNVSDWSVQDVQDWLVVSDLAN